jgi:arsenite oxidase large subunit
MSAPSDAHVGRPAAYVDQLLINGQGGVHHIWACDHYKTTLNAIEFKRVYKKRTDMVKDAMNSVPMATARHGRRHRRGDQGRTVLGRCRHRPDQDRPGRPCVLPAATSGEMNLTSMNGERRMRLTERYMDPPGQAMPDCLIAARLANHMERVLRESRQRRLCRPVPGLRLETEEDAFMDGYHEECRGRRARHLRAAARHGHQRLPGAGVGFEDGRIVGTKRLYTDGQFSTEDGRALFWMRRVARPAGAGQGGAEGQVTTFLINNGRANLVWQSAYLDVDNEFVMDRWPYPFIEMHPDDMASVGVNEGDLVEVYNDAGSTQAMVYPTPIGAARRDLHALRLSDRRAGQRRQRRRRDQRAGDPELQADLGQHPQDRRRARLGRPPVVQVQGIQDLK